MRACAPLRALLVVTVGAAPRHHGRAHLPAPNAGQGQFCTILQQFKCAAACVLVCSPRAHVSSQGSSALGATWGCASVSRWLHRTNNVNGRGPPLPAWRWFVAPPSAKGGASALAWELNASEGGPTTLKIGAPRGACRIHFAAASAAVFKGVLLGHRTTNWQRASKRHLLLPY